MAFNFFHGMIMAPVFDPSSFLLLLVMLIGGGVRDLASCLPTDAYWKSKGVTVSLDQLSGELAPVNATDLSKLIDQLDANDARERDAAARKIEALGTEAIDALKDAMDSGSPEVATRARSLIARVRTSSKITAIRRLMAMRTLGEMKDAKAVELLKSLVKSKRMFEPDYAKEAIAKIDGKDYSIPPANAVDRATELNLLPAKLDAVMQAAPALQGNISIEKIVEQLPLTADQKESRLKESTQRLITFLESVGNIRLDVVTWGFYAAPPGVPGNSIFILRGQLDSDAFGQFLSRQNLPCKKLDGGNAFEFNDDTALLVGSDQRVVFLSREPTGDLALDAMSTALKKGVGEFANNAELAKLASSVDPACAFWGVERMNPGLAQVIEPLASFDSAVLVGNQLRDEKHDLVMQLRLIATTTDPLKAKNSVTSARQMLDNLAQRNLQQQQLLPILKPFAEMARSTQFEVDEGKVTATATLRDVPMLPVVIPLDGIER